MKWNRISGHHIQTQWETTGDQSATAVATLDGKSKWIIEKTVGGYDYHLITNGQSGRVFFCPANTLSGAMAYVDNHVLPDFPDRQNLPVGFIWGGLMVDYLGD